MLEVDLWKKRVLVMGGSYFIGRRVVEVLVENNYEVYTLNRGTNNVFGEEVISLKWCENNFWVVYN